MTKMVFLAICEILIMLFSSGCCEKSDSEVPQSETVEFLEVIQYGESVEGLDVENEDNIWGLITGITGESINIKICKKVIDETAPNGWYITETNEEKTLVIADNIQVWVMQSGQFIDSRISYDDIKNYEKLEDVSIIWGFVLDVSGKVKFIYQPLLP